MKKLMFAAALMAAGAAMAVESSIVGYQQVPVIPGFVLFAPTFTGVGTTDGISLSSVEIVNADGVVYNEMGGDVTVQAMDDTGAYTDMFFYYSGFGWYGDADIPNLIPGQSLCVYNGWCNPESGNPETVYFRVAGEVDLVNKNAIAPGYILWGNGTPVDVNLADVTVVDTEGVDYPEMGGDVTVQAMDDTGAYTDMFFYYSGFGWYGDADIPNLTPGQSLCVYNGWCNQESGNPETVYFKVPCPVK